VQRRNFLKLAAGSVALPFAARGASALDYPARPVHIIVGQAAGSSSDISARLFGQYLSEHLGQQFVVEIRPGATGNIATDAVVRSAPDGYTLLLVNSQNTINAALFADLPFDFVHDIAPIAITHRVALIMEVLPSFPAKTVPEFIAYAKANPGKINMASAGVGGPQHIAGELFKSMAGVDLVHVPYHGATPALTDLLGGQVQVMFDVTPTSLPHVAAGELRALAVTTPERLDFLPGVPAMAEFLPDYEAFGWIGFGAPKGTPAPIIETLNRAINAAVADPAVRARLLSLGGLVVPPNTAAEFGKFIAADTAKWREVVKFANLKPE
jgi:tripartite-type tricarboxylate transporter receptor subunit TctC